MSGTCRDVPGKPLWKEGSAGEEEAQNGNSGQEQKRDPIFWIPLSYC